MIVPVRLETEYMKNPIGIDVISPLISWNIEGENQKAFQLVLQGDAGSSFDTGVIESNVMWYRVPFPFAMREKVLYTLKVYGESGEGNSAKGSFEMGLGKENFQAKWINPENYDIEKEKRYPGSCIRTYFEVENYRKARLYTTARGNYSVFLNGKRLPFVLEPGTFQEPQRQIYQTSDIGGYLKEGKNEILFYLTDGWHRGSMENRGETNRFGTDIALLTQVELDGVIVAASDKTWEASQNGPIQFSDLMQGETYDARLEEIKNWHKVTEIDIGYQNLVSSNMPQVTEHERFHGTLVTTPSGSTVIDFGQNIAGYVEFSFLAHEGELLELEFGETLDKDGSFTNKNFQNPKKTIYQKIIYICKNGKNSYKPFGTYMGFRYMKVSGNVKVSEKDFTAIAIYTDLEFTGDFSCGNAEINQLFSNALWSLKGNFTDIPTDCPTREKSGFTGDFQAYIHTAMYLTNCYGMARRWLKELVAAQYEDGCLPMIAPNGQKRMQFDGAGGWCDAITIVAKKIGERYNDYSAAEEVYDSMKRWVDYDMARAKKKTRLLNRKNPYKHYLLDTGMHWGEWLEPGTNTIRDMSKIALQGEPEVATAYLSVSCCILSEIAGRLGKKKDEIFYSEGAQNTKLAYHHYSLKKGKINSKRMCRYVRPLVYNLLTSEEAKSAAAELNKLVIKNNYCQNTGFLSTHELPRVLTDYGYTETAYRLLLHESCPGWIYPLRKGATTIWEQWDGIDEQGKLHASFNHYSYGAIVGWLFDRVCGIVVRDGKITIRPYPHILLKEARASYLSPYGKIVSKWRIVRDNILYDIEIPGNMSAELILGKSSYNISSGVYHFKEKYREE
ncbi:alpha-L-rhamnosidase [Anaerocolumna jejuensis DSM 15929]|uniref:alpha-L-rhamnosidase n=1 Tax=Anaerocolumna jejuensis DSM 15929 TaxID=1121322 RepID=A0A1M7BUS8_9FIRM|nr:family 78 glycoside hydrolase catalytic domain [Anaerocolumna jejuensis]SHL58663.1 alpha-L-rhamnosidase [Anaerocolumna jejuensis DSM 15929]